MHILPNISRSKESETMKLGHLIEYKMRKTFREKSYTKCDGEECYRNILKVSYILLAFTSYWAFFLNKKRSGTSLPASFSA